MLKVKWSYKKNFELTVYQPLLIEPIKIKLRLKLNHERKHEVNDGHEINELRERNQIYLMMAAMNDTSAQPSIHGFMKSKIEWIPWIGNGALI